MLRVGSLSPAEQADTLKIIDRQVDLLLANIECMAELLRINAGKFDFHSVSADLGDCFEFLEGRSSLMRELKHAGITLESIPWPAPLITKHDPHRMATALEFLVSKFSRHAARGSTVRLSLRAGPGIAIWLMEGDTGSLAEDVEFQYVLGNSSALDECEGRALLARELVLLHGLQLLPMPPADGIAFSMALEP